MTLRPLIFIRRANTNGRHGTSKAEFNAALAKYIIRNPNLLQPKKNHAIKRLKSAYAAYVKSARAHKKAKQKNINSNDSSSPPFAKAEDPIAGTAQDGRTIYVNPKPREDGVGGFIDPYYVYGQGGQKEYRKQIH